MNGRAKRLEPRNPDYDALFQFSDTPTLELDASGVVLRSNPAAARLLDVRPERARGQSLDDLLGVDVTGALASETATAVSARIGGVTTPLVVQSMRRSLQAADGDRFTVQLLPVENEEQQDATRSGEALHWSAMDDISHNLGTPLSIIGGYADTLVTHVDDMDTAAIARAAAAIHRHAARAIDELHALQARVRLGAGGAGAVPTSVLVAWLRRMLDPNLVAANAALVGTWSADTVTVDVAVARQALLNMCTVALQSDPRPRVLELTVSTNQDGTLFDLQPDVIPDDLQLAESGPFMVSVTQSLVAQAGGTYDPPEAGRPTQRLLLPSTSKDAPVAAVPTIPVAMIEDDPDTAALIRTSLRSSSTLFRIVADERTFADGLRALANCDPRIVLLDNHLPDRVSTEGLDEIRAAAPDARIVVLSARSRRDHDASDDNTIWFEKGRVLADLGTELIGVLTTGE